MNVLDFQTHQNIFEMNDRDRDLFESVVEETK